MAEDTQQAVESHVRGSEVDDGERPALHGMPVPEQRELLTRLTGEGRSDQEIGEEFGLSQWQVRNLRYKLGIKKDRGGNVYLREPSMDLEAHGGGSRGAPGVVDTRDGEAARQMAQGLRISWAGTCRAEELAGRLEGLQGLMRADLDNRLYSIRVEISER